MATRYSALRVLGQAVLLAALAVGTWWIFLGTDTERQVDPVTGSSSGPYEVPQVVGCVLVLVALVVGGTLVGPGWVAVVAVAVPFTAVWSWWARAQDDSGLWVVGSALVLIGTAGGGAVVAGVTRALRKRRVDHG